MRIEALRLPAFGSFTDKELCFARQGAGLHIIHGPNEAGKTTILRALHNLFFGFPHQSPDAHLHQAKDLAVGAVLRLEGGEILEIVRYKRRKNDLLDASGRVLSQSELASLLGGISQDLFGRIFSIGQEGLRQGAEGLLEAEGDLGQALFAAASGIAGLRSVLEELEARQAGLFRPRATTSAVHQGVLELAALAKRVRELSVRPVHWEKLQQDLRGLRARQQELLDAIFSLDTTMARLQRYRDALRHIDLCEELSRRMEGTRDVPVLAEDFTERRSRAQEALAGAEHEEDRLAFRLEQVREQIETLTLHSALLEAENEIHRLHPEAATHRKALKDIRGLETRRATLGSAIAEKLASLGKDPALGTEAATGRMTRQLKVRLETLAREHGALNADLVSATRALDEAQADLAAALTLLDELPPDHDPTNLETALAKAADLGNPVLRISEALAEIEKLKQGILHDAQTLALKPGDTLALENMPLPLPETLDRFEADISTARTRSADAHKDVQRLESALREKRAALQRLEQDGGLPGSAALTEARALRDKGWNLIKQGWLRSGSDAEEEARFIAEVPGSESLAEAFEKSLRSADSLADTLFTNASGVAQAESLRREIAGLEKDLGRAALQLQKESNDLHDLQTRWAGLWSPAGITPLPPREMQAWLARVLDIRRRLALLGEKESAHLRLAGATRDTAEELARAVAVAGLISVERKDYPSSLAMADKTLDLIRERAARKRELQSRILDLTKTRDKAAAGRDRAAAALESWAVHWAVVLQDLVLPAATTPEVAAAVALTLEEIAQAKREMDELAKRIAEMRDEYGSFSDQVLDLHGLLSPDPPDRPEDIIDRLYTQWQAEKDKKTRLEGLEQEAREVERQLHAARKTIEECRKTLSRLCAEAGCPAAEDLPRFEALARASAQARNDRHKAEERLLELAGGEDLEAFIAAARGHRPDELTAELERMRVQKKESGDQRDQCTAEIGRVLADLARLDGTSPAAEITQQISETRARLEEDVRQFVLLRLASQILSGEMERYREANQGPVLEAAGGFFARMTLGSFSGLRADYDEKGDPVIKAVREGSRFLEIRHLSEGTRDQLFLALRLGGLARYLLSNPPLPLIVDDILVNFDDQRSAATLRVLEELAASTQVLFLTHHAHLVEIAGQCLNAPSVCAL